MRSFVCNYFSPGHHILPSSHHLPMVEGVSEAAENSDPSFSPKHRGLSAVGCGISKRKQTASRKWDGGL